MAIRFERTYTIEELELFNLLQHPVWIFDSENKCMYWANHAALKVWRAPSLESLLARDFASDLSPDREYRMKEMLVLYRQGEVTKEQWTFFPNGVATTLKVSGSGILIDGGRIAILAETELPDSKAMDDSAVRGVEVLRRIPLPVFQFDMDGHAIEQNPEAMNVFGDAKVGFCDMFVDTAVGQSFLEDVKKTAETSNSNFDVEAQMRTRSDKSDDGSAVGAHHWFSISARVNKDPVTSDEIILMIARDITEVVQARHDKAAANFKTEFMAILAHDIRTPLHQIVGYLDLLELTGLTSEQSEQVRLVQVSAAALMALGNDLLDFSKLESGKLKIENCYFELHQLLDGCLAAAHSEAKEKNLSILSDITKDLPAQTTGDPFRLRQILLNLFSNSIKFTHEGTVTLTVSMIESTDDTCRVRFQVADTGIGIEENQQQSLFGKYTQANSLVALHYGGTGLGLAICKGLVETMGGTIGLNSKLGEGTAVFFEMPLAIPQRQEHSDTKATLPHLESLHILVAEDNKINQKLVRAMLQRSGHSVTIAENGEIAVSSVQTGDFDLVLMDVQMPVMDGIEATRKIRNLGYSKEDLAIVGLTASFQYSDLKMYLDIGMNDCLGKPVKLIHLQQAIDSAVRTPEL